MNRSTIFLNLVFSMSLTLLPACNKSGCTKEQAPTEIIKAEQKAEHIEVKTEKITQFASLDFGALNSTQVSTLTRLFNDEVCPCGCPKTFAQCLAIDKGCPPGQLLAQWAIEQSKLGTPERFLLAAISDEINAGFMATPLDIDLSDAQHKGNKSAPITVVEFADFECPSCKYAAKQFKEFIDEHPNDIQAYFMHYPLNTHPHAESAAIAAEAAAQHGKFWAMHDLLFAYEGPLTEQAINNLAMKIFNPKEMLKFSKDLKNSVIKEKVLRQKKYAGETLKIMATPSFFINGRPYNLSFAKDAFDLRLNMEKTRAQINCQARE